jgi:Kdo2-lipid IVA lauroyltransferase/acyltransferase
MNNLKRLRYAAEYRLLKACIVPFERWPPALAYAIAHALAAAAYHGLHTRRQVAVENIERSSLGIQGNAARRVARASFRHWADVIVESARMRPWFESNTWRSHVRVLDEATSERAATTRGGLVLASGHFGNWEVAAHALALRRPLAAISRPMDNVKVNALVERLRFYGGVYAIPKHASDPLRLLDLVAKGGALAVMIDQNAGRHGITLDFLGRPAPTYTSAAMVALVTHAPLYFGWCRRTGRMAYEVAVSGPIPCERARDRATTVREIVSRLNAELESAIRRDPEQYLWMHRRWRFR